MCMKVKIKLCGFKNIEDIIFASSLNIDYLGMIFVKDMPRSINIKTACRAADICKSKNIKSTGVFLNQSKDEVSEILNQVDLDVIQLHGSEDIHEYSCLKKEIIKTIHVSKDLPAQLSNINLEKYNYLIDATDKHMRGGTGEVFDWDIMSDMPYDKLFIAGGLKADNILDLLNKFSPHCVDVSSGIERKVGYKDHKLMSDFVHKINTFNEK
jgi:phosphoribosylanthranilate isomerase